MKTIPIFTSIPPHFVRLDSDGNDISHLYLSRCFESWDKHYFEPVSINASVEKESDLGARLGIRRINVQKDAQKICGKPLVFLNDFLSVARNEAKGPLVITNSDILLDIDIDTLQAIHKIEPGQSVVQKRIDIGSISSRCGHEYTDGYDFFAFHCADVKKVWSNPFVFGMPWWDHFLPIIMLLEGIKQIPIKRKFVYHMNHFNRWDKYFWKLFGQKYISLFYSKGEYQCHEYIRDLKYSAKEEYTDCYSWIKHKILRRSVSGKRLKNVGELNINFIDGQAKS